MVRAMSNDPRPDNTLPDDLDDDDLDPEVGNQLPDDPSQGVKNKSGERGKSAQAPGRNKPEPR
jgi:hypothetical protein